MNKPANKVVTYIIVAVAQDYCKREDKSDRYLDSLGTSWFDFQYHKSAAKRFNTYQAAWTQLQQVYKHNKDSLDTYSYYIQVQYTDPSPTRIDEVVPDVMPSR